MRQRDNAEKNKDLAKDSGIDEEEEYFEPAAEETNPEATDNDEANTDYSDKEEYKESGDSSDDDEDNDSSKTSVKKHPVILSYWDPCTDTYRNKETHEVVPDSESDEDEDEESCDSSDEDEYSNNS